MKKLLFIFAALFAVIACKPDPEPQPEVSTINEAIVQDYNYFRSINDSALFYEVEMEFTTTIDSIDSLSLISMTTVGQLGPEVYFVLRNSSLTDTVVETVQDIWLEDFDFDANVKVSVEEAIQIVKENCEVIPSTRFIILRKPVGPTPIENPLYIFGKMLATVDANTGELTEY